MTSTSANISKQRKGTATNQVIWVVAVLIAFFVGHQTGLITSHTATMASVASDTSHSSSSLGMTTSKLSSARGSKDSYSLAFEQSYGFFDDISDYNWKLMQQRARTRNNHRFSNPLKFYEEPARWYMNNFEPDFTCAQERRVGGTGDGAKWVCDPHRLPDVVERRTKELGDAKKAGCLIYSVGSGGKWQFEDGIYEMLNGLCEIHVFDPGNWAKERDDLLERNIHFHKWGFRSTYDASYTAVVNYGEFFTVEETLQKLGHQGRTIDIFKIDCEYCEWFCFEDWFKLDIRLLLVETHSLPENKQTALDYFYGFQKSNFYLYHKEPNIHPKAKGEGVEWAYIRLHPDFWSNETTSATTK